MLYQSHESYETSISSSSNKETTESNEHHILQMSTVNMWWSNSVSFSMWKRLPVNRFKSRNNGISSASHLSSEVCQYVVV